MEFEAGGVCPPRSQTVPDLAVLAPIPPSPCLSLNPPSPLPASRPLSPDSCTSSCQAERDGLTSADSPHLLFQEEERQPGDHEAWSDRAAILNLEASSKLKLEESSTPRSAAHLAMLNLEDSSLICRVATLEERCKEQEEEVAELKAGLANALNRIAALEGEKKHSFQAQNGGSRIPQRRPTSAAAASTGGGAGRKTGICPPSPSTPPSRAPPRLLSVASTPRKLTGSMGRLHRKWRSASNFDSGPQPQSREHSGCSTDAPIFSPEDGILNITLQNRAVTLVCPEDQRESYDPLEEVGPPSERLRLEWVHGYRGRDGRANLHLLPTGEMVYPMATIVVLLHCSERSQRHFTGHTEEVRCLAVHPNRLTVASGQGSSCYRRDGCALVFVWNSVSLTTLHVLNTPALTRAVSALSFSKTDGGAVLAAVEEGQEQGLVLWDWARGSRSVEARSGTDTVVAVEFHPLEDGVVITCGKGHLTFWQLEPGSGGLARKTGLLEQKDKPRYFTCLAFSSSGDLITGDSSGNILVWGRGYNAVTKAVWGMHDGPVFALCVLRDGMIVSGGAKDRRIVKCDPEFRPTGEVAVLTEEEGGVRSLAQGEGSSLVVGTTANCLLKGSLALGFSNVVWGPGELQALAPRPGQSQVITGGPGGLALWDSLAHCRIWSHDAGEEIESTAFSPDGEHLVVGGRTGRWLVLDSRTRETLQSNQAGTEPLHTVAFSPDGTRLALAARVNIHIYQASSSGGEDCKYEKLGVCRIQQGELANGVDWADDGIHLAASTSDLEILLWETNLCRPVKTSTSFNFTSSSATFSWRTLGAWAGPVPPTTCASSQGGNLLAVGDMDGGLRLLRHPASQLNISSRRQLAHWGPTTRVAFLGDTRLVTIGQDGTLLQWAVY